MSHMTDPNHLLELLRSQLALARRLQDLSRRQRTLVTRQDAAPLLALLAERQELMNEMGAAARRLAPVQEYWRERPQIFPADIRPEAEQLFDQVAETFQGVLRTDAEDSRILAARKVRTKEELQANQVGRQACTAYSGGRGPMPGAAMGMDESI